MKGSRIVVTVPATNGQLNPLVLACCKILKINEIYKVGGAQAIAMLALGTESVNKVDKFLDLVMLMYLRKKVFWSGWY